MVSSDQIREKLEMRETSGMPSFTSGQLTDQVIKTDSFLGRKMQRALDLGVSREQALNFYAYGDTTAKPREVEQRKKPFFEKATEFITEFATGPGKLLEGGLERGIGKVGELVGSKTLESFGDFPQAQSEELRKNLETTGDVLRFGIPVALTAPIGVPATLGQFGLSAGMSLIGGFGGRAIEELTDIERAPLDEILEVSLKEGIIDATIDAFTFGTFKGWKLLRAAKKANMINQVDDVVAQIIQSKAKGVATKGKDIKKGIRTFSSIDTIGVKTYRELFETIGDKVGHLSGKLRRYLARFPEEFAETSLKKTIREGSATVIQSPVTKSLDDMVELYSRTSQPEQLAKIMELKSKLFSKGLNVGEINDIAIEYGQEFGKKAFSAAGEPLTSVNSQLYKNTRDQLKEVSRNLLPDNTARLLDKEMSALIRTRQLVSDMADSVQKLAQKVKGRNIVEKGAIKLADTVNTITFGGPKSFVSRMLPSNVGLKQMNSLDLEKVLSKNLAKIRKAISLAENGTSEGIAGAQKIVDDFFGDGGAKNTRKVRIDSIKTEPVQLKAAKADIAAGELSKSALPIKVTVDPKTGQPIIFDGYHRLVKEKAKGIKVVNVDLIDNTTDIAKKFLVESSDLTQGGKSVSKLSKKFGSLDDVPLDKLDDIEALRVKGLENYTAEEIGDFRRSAIYTSQRTLKPNEENLIFSLDDVFDVNSKKNLLNKDFLAKMKNEAVSVSGTRLSRTRPPIRKLGTIDDVFKNKRLKKVFSDVGDTPIMQVPDEIWDNFSVLDKSNIATFDPPQKVGGVGRIFLKQSGDTSDKISSIAHEGIHANHFKKGRLPGNRLLPHDERVIEQAAIRFEKFVEELAKNR